MNDDVHKGVNIVYQCLLSPLRMILGNAGLSAEEIENVFLNSISLDLEGFNAKTMQFENLIESGVVDPVKVVCTSLKNAASVASIVILTGGVLIDTE